MAKLAETIQHPAAIIAGIEYPGFTACPGAPIEYFSRALTQQLMAQWEHISSEWISGLLAGAEILGVEGDLWFVDESIEDLEFLRLIKTTQANTHPEDQPEPRQLPQSAPTKMRPSDCNNACCQGYVVALQPESKYPIIACGDPGCDRCIVPY